MYHPVEQFRRIMTGRMTQWKELNPQSALGAIQVVFDNPNSGLLHYVMDSICQPARSEERRVGKECRL